VFYRVYVMGFTGIVIGQLKDLKCKRLLVGEFDDYLVVRLAKKWWFWLSISRVLLGLVDSEAI
jgi:hypothetical protein